MSYGSTILSRSPLAYIPCTESSGSSCADVTGNGHDLTGGDIHAGDREGVLLGELAARLAPGTSAHVGAPSTIPVSAPWTYEFWCLHPQPESLAELTLTVFGGPLDPGEYVRGTNLSVDAGVSQQFSAFNSFIGDYAAPDTANLTCWHHYCATWDATTLRMYHNGAPVSHDSGNGTSASWANPFTPLDIFLQPLYVDWYVNHIALYGAGLTADEVAENYAAATPRGLAPCLPLPTWVRLSHVDGQGYWRSKGDVTEEWADGAVRVRLPFATLGEAPEVLMGKDPATDLPAFCPAPVVAPYIPPPPVVVPSGVDPDEARCGAVQVMANSLALQLNAWDAQIKPLIETGVLVTVVAIVLAILALPITIEFFGAIGFFSRLTLVAGIQLFINALGDGLWAPLNADESLMVQKTLYCALAGWSGALTQANLDAWKASLDANSSAFSTSQVDILKHLIDARRLDHWQSDALIGAGAPSPACGTFTCPP